jgi:iron complex transport system substrate-binding protein
MYLNVKEMSVAQSMVKGSTSRRGVVAIAVALGVALLAGCATGGSASNGTSQTSQGTSADAATTADAFPVTISHALGETLIPEQPQRVITIGWMSQDIVAALGVAPVGVPEMWGGDENGYLPWFRTQVVDVLGAEMPAIITQNDQGEFDFEQILSLEPDLILAGHSGITENDYKRLSEIAPTVAYQEKTWESAPWQDFTREIATALGQTATAEEVIAEVEAEFEAVRTEHPEYQDLEFLYGLSLAEGGTDLGFYVDADPRVRFINDLGFKNTSALEELKKSVEGDNWYGGVSLEELDKVPADIFLAWANSEAEVTYSLEHPTFKRWEPIAEGHYLFLTDATLAMATNAPTVLSVTWAMDEFLPLLEEAVEGVN